MGTGQRLLLSNEGNYEGDLDLAGGTLAIDKTTDLVGSLSLTQDSSFDIQAGVTFALPADSTIDVAKELRFIGTGYFDGDVKLSANGVLTIDENTEFMRALSVAGDSTIEIASSKMLTIPSTQSVRVAATLLFTGNGDRGLGNEVMAATRAAVAVEVMVVAVLLPRSKFFLEVDHQHHAPFPSLIHCFATRFNMGLFFKVFFLEVKELFDGKLK